MIADTFARLRRPVTIGAVWTAYALALAASFQHVRRAFGALEPDPSSLTAIAAAAAVELGMAALALALVARRRDGARDGRLWAGLAGMAAVSALANADAALTALGGGQRPLWAAGLTVDPLDVARAMIGAGALPALVLFLAAAAETLTGAADAPAPVAALDVEPVAADLAAAPPVADAAPRRARRRHAHGAGDDPAGLDVVAMPAALTRRTAATLNAVLDAAAAAPDATRGELAAAVGCSPDTIRRAVARARGLGLLDRAGGRWIVEPRRVAPAIGAPPYRAAGELAAVEL